MMNHLFVDKVPLHKHLAVYLTHDGKWLCHTTEICKRQQDPEKIFAETL